MSTKRIKKAIILHGTEDSPQSNWFLWLKGQLEELGLSVWVPALPQSDKPSPKRVVPFILKNCPFPVDDGTMLIGHSSGAVEILHLLPHLQSKVSLAILVGSFKDNEYLKWEPLNELFSIPFNWEACKIHCNKFIYIHADNDPFCPLEQARYLCRNTGGDLIIMADQKHFSTGTMGETYRQFPRLLELLKPYL